MVGRSCWWIGLGCRCWGCFLGCKGFRRNCFLRYHRSIHRIVLLRCLLRLLRGKSMSEVRRMRTYQGIEEVIVDTMTLRYGYQ